KDKKAGDGVYYQQVLGAIELLKQRKPDIFDGKAIRLVSHYYDGLIKILAEDYGLCAVRGGAGPSDELAVKGDNSFSEQWDVLAGGSNGYVYPIWSYEVTCHPAAF